MFIFGNKSVYIRRANNVSKEQSLETILTILDQLVNKNLNL